MNDYVLEKLTGKYVLTPRDIGPYAAFDGPHGMHFTIEAYEIRNLGSLALIAMKAGLGTMKMESVILTPQTKDLALFSSDLIDTPVNDTLLLELYNTDLAPRDYSALKEVLDKYSSIPAYDTGTHWYDSYRLDVSAAKVGKRMADDEQAMAQDYFDVYLDLLSQAPDCDRVLKNDRIRDYAEGLLGQGGPAVDQLSALMGPDATRELFLKYIFGVED